MTWVTPIKPMRADEMFSVFNHHELGVYEWICGFAIAHELLNGGMTKINGDPCHVKIVDEWPELGGIHLRATVHPEKVVSLEVAA